LAILAAPHGFTAIQLAGALGNAAQAVDASLDGHFATTLDGVDLLAKRVKPGPLTGIGKQPQLVIAAPWRDGGTDQLGLLWCPEC
jgi:hypothetical protein